jgi:hypothetical protein
VNHQVSLLHFKLLILCALLFSSCSGGADSNAQLEVTDVRYESSETSRCVGEIKNVSQQPLSNLKVEVEFRTENGSRVRGSIVELPESTLAPNAGMNFSAPYIKGHNDSQVTTCGVLRIKTAEGGTLMHLERSAK